YNFQPRFVPFILDGRKQHTIRAYRRNFREQAGNVCHLYTGLRQPGARLLGRFFCTRVENIVITPGRMVRVGGEWLEPSEYGRLARADGFESSAAMMDFWTGRLPFNGQIIHWQWNQDQLANQGKTKKARSRSR